MRLNLQGENFKIIWNDNGTTILTADIQDKHREVSHFLKGPVEDIMPTYKDTDSIINA